MSSNLPRRFVWVLLGLVLLGAGCSKDSRLQKRIAAGDKQLAAGEYDIAEAEYRAALQLSPNDTRILGRLGIMAYNQGRVPSGYFLLQGSLKAQPDDLNMQLHFGLASLALAKTADARAAAKKVLEKQPTNEDAILLLVETCITTRDNEEARRIIQQLQEQHKDVAAYHVGLAVLSLIQKDEAAAEADLRKALALDPKSSAAHAHLGNLFIARRDPKTALEHMKIAAELSPLRAARRMKYIDYLIRLDSDAEARKELGKITAKAPDYVPALSVAMKLAFHDKAYDEADKLATKILARDRVNYDALMQRAALKLVKNDPDGVIAALKDVETHYNRAPQIKYQLALAYLKKGDSALAEENLNQAINLSPSYDEAIVLLAELRLKKGDTQAATTSLRPLIQRSPGFTQAYVLLARAYQMAGNGEESLRVLRALQEVTPKAPESSFLTGLANYQLGRLDEARVALERSVQLSESYWPALELLVEVDMRQNRKAAAAERVETLIAKHGKLASPWLFRARIRLADNNTAGAESDLLKAIEAEPNSQYAYLLLSRLYFQVSRGQDAVQKMVVAATNSNSIGAHMQLGMMQAALNQHAAARQAYEKVLAMDPRFVPALNNLAMLFAEHLGEFEKGLALAEKARDFAPGDPIVADTLGWLNFRRGRYDTALPLLQSSAEAAPREAEIQFHLGMVYYQLGQEENARQIFQRVSALPTDSTAKQEAQKRLGVLAIDAAKATAAVRADLEERLKRDPSDLVALTRLGAIKEREGAPREAAAHYEAALKITPRSFSTLLALVNLYVGPLKDPAKARELAKGAHNLQPTDSQAAWRFGRLIYEAGDYPWSVTLLQEAARQLPNQPNLSYDLAQAQFSVGRVSDAEAALKQALASQNLTGREGAQRMAAMIAAARSPATVQAALPEARRILATEPTYVPALMITALALELQKDYRGARQVYEKILAQNAAFVPATRNLAIVLADQLADDQKGEELALKARQTLPDDPDLAFTLGAISYRKADYPAAVRYLRQGASRRPNHAQTLFFLGMSLYQMKNAPESRAQLTQAIQAKLPPQEEHEARRVLEELNRARSEG